MGSDETPPRLAAPFPRCSSGSRADSRQRLFHAFLRSFREPCSRNEHRKASHGRAPPPDPNAPLTARGGARGLRGLGRGAWFVHAEPPQDRHHRTLLREGRLQQVRADERGEEWMRLHRLRFELGMKLRSDEPGMAGQFDDLESPAMKILLDENRRTTFVTICLGTTCSPSHTWAGAARRTAIF